MQKFTDFNAYINSKLPWNYCKIQVNDTLPLQSYIHIQSQHEFGHDVVHSLRRRLRGTREDRQFQRTTLAHSVLRVRQDFWQHYIFHYHLNLLGARNAFARLRTEFSMNSKVASTARRILEFCTLRFATNAAKLSSDASSKRCKPVGILSASVVSCVLVS